MALVRDRCICLRKVEYSETSQILSLLGREHGIVRVIAKGAHRRTKAGASKFDGGVDLLDVGHAVFTHASERELGTLTEWSLRQGHRELHQHLRGMYLAQYGAELVTLLFEEHDPHPQLFDRLYATLLDLPTSRAEETFLAFELDLLRESGYSPSWGECVMCGREVTERAWFSPAAGGIVCRSCESVAPDRAEIDLRLVRLVRSLMSMPRSNGQGTRLPQLTRHQTDPINKLLIDHVEHTLSKRLRMRGYVLG